MKLLKKLSSLVENHIITADWNYERINRGNDFKTSFRTNNGILDVLICCEEETRMIFVHSILPLAIPDSGKIPIYDLLNRINNRIILGRFCLDPYDGLVSNRTCSNYSGCEIADETIYHLIQSNIKMLDHYIPAIMDVVYNHNIPVLAFLERD